MTTQITLADFQPRWDEMKTLPSSEKQKLVESYKQARWEVLARVADSKRIKKLKDGTAEFLMGLALHKTNMPVSSFAVLASLVDSYPTSSLLNQCLELITEVFQGNVIETGLLQEIFDKRILKVSSPEAKAILKYHRFLSLRSRGFYKWAGNEIKTLPKNTFWRYYFQFVNQVRRSEKLKSRSLLKAWTRFSEDKKLPESIRGQSKINKARALYELGLYKAADAIYKTVSHNRFDQGTILRERAWLYYRLNQFKEALGMINQMRTSVYGFYHHVDEHLLAGLIYRESCQPELLEGLKKEVDKQIAGIKKSVKRLKQYDNFRDIFQFSIYHPLLSKTARMMAYFNEERELLENGPLSSYSEEIEPARKKLSEFSMTKINEQLPLVARHSIENLLILKEQIDYLSYSLRLRRTKDVQLTYAETAGHIRSGLPKTSIVWPVYGEVWNDEVINYRSTLENRCL